MRAKMTIPTARGDRFYASRVCLFLPPCGIIGMEIMQYLATESDRLTGLLERFDRSAEAIRSELERKQSPPPQTVDRA